ncbi:MAG: glutathione S-transferase family protein [Sphingopyxis solisilvae]|uniref:glutathione S-transferase family protein n=1 Tax=Sphingopyxis solisilvae TaxID=1886788 RepID=UPI00403700C8
MLPNDRDNPSKSTIDRSIIRPFLFTARLSMFSAKVEIALHEKAIGYDREFVPFELGTGYHPKHPDVVAANPKSQVPVLIDGPLTIYDSTQIFEYLEDAYPAPPLWPQLVPVRVAARQWEHWSDEILFPPALALIDRSLDQADRRAAAKRVNRHLDRLNSHLGDARFVAGDFSYADVALFMAEFFVVLFGLARQPRPGILAWRRRLLGRSSFRSVIEPMAAYAEELGIAPAARLIGERE